MYTNNCTNNCKSHPWLVVAAAFGLALFSPISARAYSEASSQASSEASSESALQSLNPFLVAYNWPGYWGGGYGSGYGPSFPGFPGFGSNGVGAYDIGIDYSGYGPGNPGFPGYGANYDTGISYNFGNGYRLPMPVAVPVPVPVPYYVPQLEIPTPPTGRPTEGLASTKPHTYATVFKRERTQTVHPRSTGR